MSIIIKNIGSLQHYSLECIKMDIEGVQPWAGHHGQLSIHKVKHIQNAVYDD